MGSIARFINGVISAAIVVFFLVHASMGTLSALFDFKSSLAWTVWIGVVVVLAHILVSVVTSIQQLNDKKYPPSTRKKLHLLLKWITGVLLAVAAIVHIVCIALYDGVAFQVTASGMMALTWAAPWTSMSSTTVIPCSIRSSTWERGVP